MFLSNFFPAELNQLIALKLDLVSAIHLGRVNKQANAVVNGLFSDSSGWKYKEILARLKHFWDETLWELTDEEIEHFFKYNQLIEHIKEWGMEYHRQEYGDCCRTTYFKELLIDFWDLNSCTLINKPMNLLNYSELMELVVVQHAAQLELKNSKYSANTLLQNMDILKNATWEIISSRALNPKDDASEKHYYIKMTYKTMTRPQCIRLINLLNETYQVKLAYINPRHHKVMKLFQEQPNIQQEKNKSTFYLRADLFCSKMLGRLGHLNTLVSLEELSKTVKLHEDSLEPSPQLSG